MVKSKFSSRSIEVKPSRIEMPRYYIERKSKGCKRHLSFDPVDWQDKAQAGKRFEDEAGILVALDHSGIPHIFEYFHEGGYNYIVMQFVQGWTLETDLTYEDDTGHAPSWGKFERGKALHAPL